MQREVVTLPPGKKIYFASDFHLGAPNLRESRMREKHIIRWINSIEDDAHSLYLVGDTFDFWFEYKNAIPKGFIRLQGKLADLLDKGIRVTLLSGNHDMWMFDYFQQEIGATVYLDPIEIKVGDRLLMVGHGDGLGTGEWAYKILKKIYTNSLCQWLFTAIHPDIGIQFAKKWSVSSRQKGNKKANVFVRKENEKLFAYCIEREREKHRHFYVFGHRHLPLDLPINATSRYINLGDWIHHNTYGVYDGKDLDLKRFNPPR